MKDQGDKRPMIVSNGSENLTHLPQSNSASAELLPLRGSASLVSEDESDLPSSSSTRQPERPPPLQDHNNPKNRQKEQKKPRQKKRHGARNQHRHKFFVKWLLDTFDLERSSVNATTSPSTNSNSKDRATDAKTSNDENSDVKNRADTNSRCQDNNIVVASCDADNSNRQQTSDRTETITSEYRSPHILDVAGGKGEVSARLTMCHRQRVVMVDPRPADIVDCFERIVLPKIPNKWQRRLNDQREANPDFVSDIIKSRFRQLVTTFDQYKILIDLNEDDWRPSPSKISESREDLAELQAAVQNATLIVGLHADGATEAIVDAALKYHKPFVVVPCCVFPNFFPMRRLCIDEKDGNPPKMIPVRTHEQFCKYLLQKDPRFVMEELPFEGRNIAIWWDGK